MMRPWVAQRRVIQRLRHPEDRTFPTGVRHVSFGRHSRASGGRRRRRNACAWASPPHPQIAQERLRGTVVFKRRAEANPTAAVFPRPPRCPPPPFPAPILPLRQEMRPQSLTGSACPPRAPRRPAVRTRVRRRRPHRRTSGVRLLLRRGQSPCDCISFCSLCDAKSIRERAEEYRDGNRGSDGQECLCHQEGNPAQRQSHQGVPLPPK